MKYLLLDDTVLSKEHSQHIEPVRRQYSGSVHGLVKGIGIVNCVYYNPDTAASWLIDYRLFSPETDGKSKLDHVQDMLKLARARGVPFQTVLMDSWYATTGIFKHLLGEEKTFCCPIKADRKIDATKGKEPYKQVQEAFWSDADVAEGKAVKLFRLRPTPVSNCLRLLVSPTRTDYVITNDINQNETEAAEEESRIRWKIEQLHREEKRITGTNSNTSCSMII